MSSFMARMRQHLRKPASEHRQIAQGFLWVSLFVLVGKLAGAGKEMAIAWRYGTSTEVDAYVFVFNMVNWPVTVWMSIVAVVLLPLAARLKKQAPAQLHLFRAELLGFAVLVGALLGLLVWALLPILTPKGHASSALLDALPSASWLALLTPLGTVIGLLSAWLMASGRHRNTLFEGIPALTLLLALLMPASWLQAPLVWGTVIGFALHLVALAIPLWRSGQLPMPKLDWQSDAWPHFWTGMGIMVLGQALTSCTTLVDQFFAIDLGPGALSTLSYANRILALVTGLGATAISRATLPVFSEAATQGSASVNTLALQWFKWMLGLALLALVVCWPLAPWMVRLLFERGAFTAHDSQAVTELLRLSLLQVLFFFPALVLVNALAAQRRHRWIALSGGINLALKLPLACVLVQMHGVQGLVLSTVVMYAVSCGLLWTWVRHKPTKAHLTP